MKQGPVLAIAALVLGAALTPAAGADLTSRSPSRAGGRAIRAESLYVRATVRLADERIEARRVAIRELEEAVLLAPDDSRYQNALGRVYLDAGFTDRARACFERAAALSPDDASPRFGLGEAWKRDWLSYLAPSSLAHATEDFAAATRLDPALGDAWVMLAPLLYEQGDLSAAYAAAEQACAAGPDHPAAQLALAYLAYRRGMVARADSLFAISIPRIPLELKARFEDITPLISREDGEALQELSPRMQAEFVRRFWSENDPDPTTVANEARLEYWARIAHASLVFLDPRHPRWDLRAELYARFGAPRRVAYDPSGVPLAQKQAGVEWWRMTLLNGPRRVGEPAWFPLHVQVWDYPDLGMRVLVQDPGLAEHYRLPHVLGRDPDPIPDPAALARNGLVATAGGRAVFPPLPPGVRALPVAGRVFRFEGDQRTRLLAQLETPGTPVDSLWAVCVVVDSSEHEIARASRELSPSGCDPSELRTADFAFEVPPGIYRVGFSVRDDRGGRGVLRATEQVEPAPATLAMSDVVVVCGPIEVARNAPEADPGAADESATSAPAIRLGPNLRARVTGDDPLIAYFELYHLLAGPDGQARFEYEYTVHAEEKAPRPWIRRVLGLGPHEPRIQVRSEEVNWGPLRRQFITVPVQSLPPGRYRLEIRLRDLNAGTTTTGAARFERLAAAEPGR